MNLNPFERMLLETLVDARENNPSKAANPAHKHSGWVYMTSMRHEVQGHCSMGPPGTERPMALARVNRHEDFQSHARPQRVEDVALG